MALSQRELVDTLSREVELGNAPPYFPALFNSPLQSSLDELQVTGVAGKTFLDVGCNLGLRCFEAVAQGASRVIGVDVNPIRVAQARALARSLGLPVDFRCADDDVVPLPASDIVVCTNVLNRVSDPIALLDRLGEATRAGLHVSFSSLSSQETAGIIPNANRLTDLPIVLIGRNGPSLRVPEGSFYLNGNAVRNLLVHHQARFSDVDVSTSPGDGSMTIIRAVRRRIGRLLVVAGISGVGKTTFLDRLQENREDAKRLLGVDDLASWSIVDAVSYPELKSGSHEKLCLHYDLSRGYRYPARGFRRDPALQSMRDAESVTCVTLWAPPAVVRARKTDRMSGHSHASPGLAAKLKQAVGGRRATGQDWEAQQAWDARMLDYPQAILEQYGRWFAYCESAGVDNHIVVDTSSAYRRIDASELSS